MVYGEFATKTILSYWMRRKSRVKPVVVSLDKCGGGSIGVKKKDK